jgi:hypothetical protein
MDVRKTLSETKNKAEQGFWYFVSRGLLYIGILSLFVLNLCAVSVSLQCAKTENRGLFGKIFGSLFAFMFGFLYLLINYKYYRVGIKKDMCSICRTNIFPF